MDVESGLGNHGLSLLKDTEKRMKNSKYSNVLNSLEKFGKCFGFTGFIFFQNF